MSDENEMIVQAGCPNSETARTPVLHGLVLAGGRSSRMGADKAALVHPDGRTLARRCHDLLGETGCGVVVLSLRCDQEIPAGFSDLPELRIVRDPVGASGGPLAGIIAAMSLHPDADWLVLACDLPRLDLATLRHLISSKRPDEMFLSCRSEWVGPDNKSAETGRPRDELPGWKAELLEIWISPGNDFRGHHGGRRGDHGIERVDEVECVAGMGLMGDRYFGYKPEFKGQVTFFDADAVQAVREHLDRPGLSGGEFRRNLIVGGVDLSEWVGRRFRFQGVEFEGSEECKPCYWMDEAVAPGTWEFLKPACRGGLRARILTDGILHATKA